MRYVMRELLGVGGMGQVYRAWDPELGREVALKLLRGGPQEVGRRALREARAQARVDHPNVCQIFEVGEADGKPFIAMQLVRGRSLAEAAAELDLRQKIQVIRQVAEAVQAAHNRGLVHRDIKPSNVLVEFGDAPAESTPGETTVPRPFVVDFGLALGPDDPRITATGELSGSPAYLAPELVLEGAPADRRSDVYSLGATLYEILSGEIPYEGATALEVFGQMAQTPPPGLGEVAPDLPRDLVWVVEKCMDRDRQRRYGSARLLAEDLDRFLAGEPVLARPPSVGYRVARWLDRHRAVAAITALFLGLSLIGAVRYTVDLRQERRQAEEARVEAERVAEFLGDILRSGDPRLHQGEVPSVRQIVDRASRGLDRGLESKPRLRARFDGILGSIYVSLGEHETAEEHLERALVATRGLGDDGAQQARILEYLADLRRVQGRFDEAEELLQQALERVVDDDLRGDVLYGLAAIAVEGSEFDRGRELLGEVLRLRRRGDDPSSVASALLELARLEREAGRLERAEAHFGEALPLLEESGDAVTRASALNNLGMLYHEQGRLPRAIESFHRALDLRRDLYGDDHRSVASALNNLGRSARQAGDFATAARAYEEVLQIYGRTLEPGHYWVGIVRTNLGRLYRETGEYDRAVDELEDARRILLAAVGERQPRTHLPVYTRALVDLDRGRMAAAGEGLEQVRQAFVEILGAEHAHVGKVHRTLAAWHRRAGRPEAAERSLRRALDILGRDATDPDVAGALALEALVACDRGRLDRAEALGRDVVKALGPVVESRPGDAKVAVPLARAQLALARSAAQRGFGSEAERHAEAGLARLAAWSVEDSAMSWLELRAELLDLLDRRAEADALREHLRRRGYVPLSHS